MIDFFILLIKYWYITLPVLVIIGVLQQDDNKEKEKLKQPQSGSPADRENISKVIRKESFPIRSLTAYISEGNQLISLARDWVIGLDEPYHTNYQTRDKLNEGYAILEKLDYLAAEVNAITLEDLGMGILDVQIGVILFVDEFRYQVEKRDPEKKGMLSDSYEFNEDGTRRDFIKESIDRIHITYGAKNLETVRLELNEVAENATSWIEMLDDSSSNEILSRDRLNYGYTVISKMKALKEDLDSGIIQGFSDLQRLNLIARLEKMIDSFSHEVEFRDPDKHQLIRLLDNDKELLALHLQVIKYTNLIFDNIMTRDIHQELLAEHTAHYQLYEEVIERLVKMYLSPDLFEGKPVQLEDVIEFMTDYMSFQKQAIQHLNRDEVREYTISRRLLDNKMAQYDYKNLL